MPSPTISLRIAPMIWHSPGRLEELLEMLKSCQDAIDENLDNSLNEPWQHLVDLGGGVSPSCFCASDPEYQGYLRQVFRSLADAGPEFIWIDDDLRMISYAKAIKLACFCPYCLQIFSKRTGHIWKREELQDAFTSGSREDQLEIRRQWQSHIQEYLADLLRLVREAVDMVNSNILIGLMTVDSAYTTYDYSKWVNALAGKRQVEVKWRPGGGFYVDDAPLGLLYKAHGTGRQVASLPAYVTDLQWEHENFPYHSLRKSKTINKAEMAAAIAIGCTGVALNIMGLTPDPLGEYRPLLDEVQGTCDFLFTAARTFGRSPCEGVWTAYTPFHFSSLNLGGNWADPSLWCRRDEMSHPAVMILNVSLDRADDLEVNLLSRGRPLRMMRMEGTEERLLPVKADGPYFTYRIDSLPPWQAALLPIDVP